MIRKIKHKDGVVEIHSEEQVGKATKEVVFKCSELPHPDLITLFTKLIKIARGILEVGDTMWVERMRISSVSYSMSENTGVMGAVITGTVELAASNSPFCFNTPHLPFKQYSNNGNLPMMPEEGVEILERLAVEAKAYMTGEKRAQMEFAKT